MATPHIESLKEDIAKTVLMPGDPLRAKYIADTYLSEVKLVNTVRGMTAFTGKYKGKTVTVFPSGMGIPSMAIYVYELFKFYDVDKIIRIGSCGSLVKDINIYDIILVNATYTDSNFSESYSGSSDRYSESSTNLNKKIIDTSNKLGKKITVGNVFCTESFYSIKGSIDYKDSLAVEMETHALFTISKSLKKESTAILTVSDSLVTQEEISSADRERQFNDMIIIALESNL